MLCTDAEFPTEKETLSLICDLAAFLTGLSFLQIVLMSINLEQKPEHNLKCFEND